MTLQQAEMELAKINVSMVDQKKKYAVLVNGI